MDPSGMKYFCGLCEKTINKNETCIHCVECLQWVHAKCNNLYRKDVKNLDLKTFVCEACMKKRKNETSRKRRTQVKQNKLKDNNENISNDNVDMIDANVKEESGSDGEFEEFEGYEKYSGQLSEFELTRLENIKRNREMFDEYDIKGAKEEMSVKKQKSDEGVVGLTIKREKKDWVSLPRRKSLRIQNMPAEPLKEVDIQRIDKDETWGERKPKEMKMKCINDVEDGIYGLAVKSWLEDKDDAKCDSGHHSDYTSDMIKYKEKISSLSVTDIARVTEKRAFSIAWYPSKTKKVICVGSVNGSMGIWDIDRSKEKNCVFLFGVHSRPVSCLTFSPFDHSKMYSCSYDGTLTCGDLNKLNFSRKYSDEDYGSYLLHFSFPYQQRNTLLLANSYGEVLTLDQSAGKIVQTFKVHNKKRCGVRCVDCHPLNENLIATSLGDGTLASWDLRYLDNSGGKKCLSSFKAAKTIVKSFFSPSGNKMLMTSQDHYLRVFDVNEAGIFKLPPRHQIKHENYYGRYLTTFRATWDPKTDHSFVCGSMANPRRVDLFGCDEKEERLLSYTLHDERFTTISSLNVFHPEFDLIASANSSGKVFVWS